MEDNELRLPAWLVDLADDPDFPKMVEAWKGTMAGQLAMLNQQLEALIDVVRERASKRALTKAAFRCLEKHARREYRIQGWLRRWTR